MSKLDELREYAEQYSTAPTVEGMTRRTLADKGINGPTGAHVIEEVHIPFNLAYLSVTTGTTAFQNITGIAHAEIEGRVQASGRALELAGVEQGENVLFTYPPLVNVFSREALERYGVSWCFLHNSSRDALILALAERQPRFVVGESSFLRATLEDAKRLGFLDLLPKGTVFITAGTPLDLEFPDVVKRLVEGTVHDLYGCQEFGWLTMDGIPLREDITMIPVEDEYHDCIVGGLPTGDRFPVMDTGHICNRQGKIITYSRIRTEPDYETIVLATTAAGMDTIERLAKTILRIKARIVRVDPYVELSSKHTTLSLSRYGDAAAPWIIDGPTKTHLFDALLRAQMDYQSQDKTDPAWIKCR